MDVLFLNPPSPDNYIYIRDINRSGRRSRERTIWPQTSLALLAAVAKQQGLKVGLIDCMATGTSWEQLKKRLKQKPPRYLVVNAITSIISNDLYATYLGKYFGARTICVGPHVTALAQSTLERFPTLDYAIMGEPEDTLAELIATVDSGGDLAGVRGLAYRDEKGSVHITDTRPFIEDLDRLPIALQELLPISRHHLPYVGSNFTFVVANRGCPYFCTFCRQPIMWGRQVRTRSAGSIMQELLYLDRLGVHNILFHSDTFTIDRRMVMELCELILQAGLRLRWICNSRVDTVDPELLGAMAGAGCQMVAYGIETANDQLLQNAKKGGAASVEKARKAIEWTKQAGMKVWAYFIMGLPGENPSTVERTINWARSMPVDIANFAVAAPYPGTELERQAREQGWLESEDWEDFDQNYSAILSYPDFSSEQVRDAVKRAYRAWYLRPKGIKALAGGINSWRDLTFLMRVGWDHLRIGSEPR